jgi:hypothetical protein
VLHVRQDSLLIASCLKSELHGAFKYIYVIVACRPVDRQRLLNKPLTIQQPLLSNGSANKHISTETIALQQTNGVFFAVLAKILKADPVSCCS